MAEVDLINQRLRKVEELRAMGQNPYRNGFSPTHTTAEVRQRFADVPPPDEPTKQPQPLSDERFRLAGRIVEHRSFGKACLTSNGKN